MPSNTNNPFYFSPYYPPLITGPTGHPVAMQPVDVEVLSGHAFSQPPMTVLILPVPMVSTSIPSMTHSLHFDSQEDCTHSPQR